jgi:hypothetical protein
MTRRRNDTSPVTRRVTVVSLRGQRGVVAVENIEEGEVILAVNGRPTNVPSRYSIQIGENEHIDLPHDAETVRGPGLYPWQYLNHSCEANAMLVGRNFVALRTIRPAEEVTFNYNASEYDMAAPFECCCGMPSCGGQRIAGFRHLSAEQQQALLPYLTDTLRAHLAAQPPVRERASGTAGRARVARRR